ncbi:MAG: triose-phosphate isomerase [Dehalococcoidia bacterium]|nr:triose-phosphate isomerase [Dehalococcoidia bacterium]
MRIPFIAGNWKMNTTVGEAEKLVKEMVIPLDAIGGIEKVLCPPFVSLLSVKKIIQGFDVGLGAQNMYFELKGAYTGEISPLMLGELCEYVILGHSERRLYFGEVDDLINRKVRASLDNGLKPILCVGEKPDEKEEGRTEEVIGRQLRGALSGIEPTVKLTVAYEPVWAIGTGKAASGEQATVTVDFIREVVAGLWNREVASGVRVLYGGSVTASNVGEFVASSGIDGALIGGASLRSEEFVSIVSRTADLKGAR